MTKELREMDYGQLVEYSKAVMKELRRKAYAEGYKQGRFDAKMEHYRYEPSDDITYWSPQAKRDRVVEQAKKDVEELSKESSAYRLLRTKFVVNREKRTVVCLLERFDLGYISKKGIAKCAPDDCFNVHIGKAIALRRALGLEVPDEYLIAPQPTEVRVGDIVHNPEWRFVKPYKVSSIIGRHAYDLEGNYAYIKGLKTIDDSREGVS